MSSRMLPGTTSLYNGHRVSYQSLTPSFGGEQQPALYHPHAARRSYGDSAPRSEHSDLSRIEQDIIAPVSRGFIENHERSRRYREIWGGVVARFNESRKQSRLVRFWERCADTIKHALGSSTSKSRKIAQVSRKRAEHCPMENRALREQFESRTLRHVGRCTRCSYTFK